METPQSGMGVFYQAMPAIGADGKRIMKLIPVQMVNGQYVQIQTSKPKAAPTSPPAAMKMHPLVPKLPVGPGAEQPSSSTLSSMKVPSTPGDPGLRRLPVMQQQPRAVSVLSKIHPKTTFVTTSGESVQRPSQLPVTVNSPAVPKGQYLQILPPNAQMWTVPASQLPQGVKTQIVSPSSTPGALNVVFVSPVTTTSLSVSPPGEPRASSVRELSTTLSQTSGAKPHLKLIPKVSRRPNSPTRWVVEEVGDSAVVNGKPSHSSDFFQTDHQGGAVFKEACLQSSKNTGAEEPALPRRWVIEEEHVAACPPQSVVSEFFQVLSRKEKDGAQQEAIKDIPSSPSQGQKNNLLMCNGKLFFVANKNMSVQATSPTNGSELHQSVALYSPPASVDGAAAKSPAERRNLGEVDEVIDLCDEEELPGQAGSAALPDEDNVIFVSYSPPKSQSGSTSHSVPLLVQGKVKERVNRRGSDRGGEPVWTWPVCHQVGSSSQPDVLEVDTETKSPGDQSNGETKSPGDQSNGERKSSGDQSNGERKSPGDQSNIETKSPGDQSNGETKSPGDQSNIETKSPGDQSNGERKSPGDQSNGERKSPGDQSNGERKSPGDQSNGERKSPGDQSNGETKSPGDQSSIETKSPGDQSNIETKSPGDQSNIETKSPGDQSNIETKSPGDQSNGERKSPGDQSNGETKSPGDQSNGETKSPGDQSNMETKISKNISTSCAHMWTVESCLLTDARLRQIHGVTADVRVVLQRIDEAARPLHDEDLGPGSALEDLRPQEADGWSVSPSQTLPCLSSITLRSRKPPCDRRCAVDFVEPRGEDQSGDTAVQPNTRRLGRTRKRTICKCCSPEAKSSTRVAGHAPAEPPSKKGAGAKTPSGDEEPCRRHSGPATRSKQTCETLKT